MIKQIMVQRSLDYESIFCLLKYRSKSADQVSRPLFRLSYLNAKFHFHLYHCHFVHRLIVNMGSVLSKTNEANTINNANRVTNINANLNVTCFNFKGKENGKGKENSKKVKED